MKEKITFGIFDQLGHKSATYREHIRDITRFSVDTTVHVAGTYDWQIVESNSFDDILQRADDAGCRYVYIVAMGYTTASHRLILDIITEAKHEGYAMSGHVLDDQRYTKTDCPGFYRLHHQGLFLDMDAWRTAGKPAYGNAGKYENIKLPYVVRSTDNIHDDYTPLYIKTPEGLEGKVEPFSGNLYPGWQLIAGMLKAGYKIGNFSNRIRMYKGHLYPELDDNRFERILAGEKGIEVEPEGPTYAQYNYLQNTDFSRFIDSTFIFNNDNMRPERLDFNPTDRLNTLYAVAAGFKPIQLLTQMDYTHARVVYIDYSRQALDYRKWLYENWDGVDYIAAIEEYQRLNPGFKTNWLFNKSDEDKRKEWEETIAVFGGRDQWTKVWANYKKLPHSYIQINLLGDYKALLKDMLVYSGGNNIIWVSNSFYTEATIRNYSPDELRKIWKRFLSDIIESNVSVQLIGCDYKGEGFHQHHYGKRQLF